MKTKGGKWELISVYNCLKEEELGLLGYVKVE